jgi:hypothetical protein
MAMSDDPSERVVDPKPSRSVDLDLAALGRLVELEGGDLSDGAAWVNQQLVHLWRAEDWLAAGAEGGEPASTDELIARLNGIGATAYRLARHVRTLDELAGQMVLQTRDGGDQGTGR